MLKSKNELTFTPSLLTHFHYLIHAFDYNPVIFSPVVPFFSHPTSSSQAPTYFCILVNGPLRVTGVSCMWEDSFKLTVPLRNVTPPAQQLLTEGWGLVSLLHTEARTLMDLVLCNT